MLLKFSTFTAVFLSVILAKDFGCCSDIDSWKQYEPVLYRYVRSAGSSNSQNYLKRSLQPNDFGYGQSAANDYGKEIVDRLVVLENNIVNAGVQVVKGTPEYGGMLFSKADNIAFNLSKEAYINMRASLYICARYNRKGSQCAEQMKQVLVNSKETTCKVKKYRNHSGRCNNFNYPSWGSTYTPYLRLSPEIYSDGIWHIQTFNRRVSDALTIGKEIARKQDVPDKNYTLALAAWTGLISYDMAHTVSYRMMHTNANIMCCTKHNRVLSPRYRHPFCMPIIDDDYNCVNYVRSMLSIPQNRKFGSAQHMNTATHYLDGSSIYGTSSKIANDNLRLKKNGLLKILADNCDTGGEPCLLAGDLRPSMDPVSAVIHTVLMREHNRIALSLSEINPHWGDEILYQEARRIVIAEIQYITYHEWLPLVIGNKLAQENYNTDIDPGVYNSFANAAMQFVYSLFDNQLSLYNESRTSESSIPMRFSFVKSDLLKDEETMDSLIRTLATQNSQAFDLRFSTAVTQYLYSENDGRGLNAVSLIIQRGRDHGLPSYTSFRNLFELPYKDFNALKNHISKETLEQIRKLYSEVELIDLFVGGMAELPEDDALLGPTFANIIRLQMKATKEGDQYFYSNRLQKYPFTSEQLNEIRKTSLSRLLCDNGRNITTMQPKAFQSINSDTNKLVNCSDETVIRKLNLQYWKNI